MTAIAPSDPALVSFVTVPDTVMLKSFGPFVCTVATAVADSWKGYTRKSVINPKY